MYIKSENIFNIFRVTSLKGLGVQGLGPLLGVEGGSHTDWPARSEAARATNGCSRLCSSYEL